MNGRKRCFTIDENVISVISEHIYALLDDEDDMI